MKVDRKIIDARLDAAEAAIRGYEAEHGKLPPRRWLGKILKLTRGQVASCLDGLRSQGRIPPSAPRHARGDRPLTAEHKALVESVLGWLHVQAERSRRKGDCYEDALSEAMFAAVQGAPRYDPARGAPTTYFASVVHNRLRRPRARDRHVLMEDGFWHAAGAPRPDGLPPGEEDAARVRAAVEAMPTGDRSLIRLVYWGGLSVSAAARDLGVSPETARNRMRRALARLRETLSDLE